MIRSVGVGLCTLLILISCTPPADDDKADASENGTVISVAGKEGDFVSNPTPPSGADREFSTDFSRSLVDFSEIVSGGPPKDGIPAINDPQFESMRDADQWIEEHEMVFIIDGATHGQQGVRIYPVQIFIYHEIVNDRFGNTPISITYCPLCNSALAFDGRVDGLELRLGVSGRLRFSNMIMYDDKTDSWWQQATGKAIVGELVGTRLKIVPLLTASWGEAKELYDDNDARVLSRNTGYNRPYGRNPYSGYDTSAHPFLFLRKEIDKQHEPFERVVVGRVNGEEKAFLYSVLQKQIVTEDIIGDRAVVLFWATDSASPLDASTTGGGRQVGSANIFDARLDSRTLTFAVKQGRIFDRQTESEWNPLGIAVSGPLKSQQLTSLPSIQHFWFSYAAFSE